MSPRAAAPRWLLAAAAVIGATAAASLLLGLAAGASLQRAVSLGFYAVGCLAMVVGFAFGTQNPFRGLPEGRGPEHHRENRRIAVVLILVGVAMVLIGVGLDSRVHVF